MRVAHVARWFSPLTETFIYDQIVELQRQGVECHVLARQRVNTRERPFPRVHETGVPHRWSPRALWERVHTRLQTSPAREPTWAHERSSAAEWLESVRPDLVHAHFGPAAGMVAPLTERMGIPLVASFYGYDASRLLREPGWLETYRSLWDGVAAVVVLSADMGERLTSAGCPPQKCKVVHLAKRLSDYRYRPPPRPIENVVSVGRLVEKKGHLDLLAAIHQLAQSGSALNLEIIGEGPLREVLEAYVRTNDLGARVKLTGALPHDRVVERLARADAFALCSKTAPNGDREGTPTVLLEAQAIGLPCISTRHAGIPETIPEESHWLLAEEGDVEGIASCLEKLRTCSVRELETIAARGRSLMEGHFDVSKEAAKLRSVYASCVGSTSSTARSKRP